MRAVRDKVFTTWKTLVVSGLNRRWCFFLGIVMGRYKKFCLELVYAYLMFYLCSKQSFCSSVKLKKYQV